MFKIWKFTLKLHKLQTISMPINAKILSTQMQSGIPCMWVQVDSDAKSNEQRTFSFIPTGLTVNYKHVNYLATLQFKEGQIVQHLYEVFDGNIEGNVNDDNGVENDLYFGLN